MSRPVELERNLLLSNTEYWTELLKDNKDVGVSYVFLDTKTGFIISIYNTEDALKAHEKYLETLKDSENSEI